MASLSPIPSGRLVTLPPWDPKNGTYIETGTNDPSRFFAQPGASVHDMLSFQLAGPPWMPDFSRGLARFVEASNEHLLFGRPLSCMAIQMSMLGYLQNRRKGETNHFLSFAIKVALDDCATQLSGATLQQLARHFPDVNFSLPEALKQKQIEDIVEQQPPSNGRRTTMVIAVGRDKCLLDLALNRGDRVIAVEPDRDACASIRAHYGASLSDGQLILEQTSAVDEPFLQRYCGDIDLLYSIYSNSNVDLFTAFNVLRPGALFVYVNGGDGTHFQKIETTRFLNHNPEDEFAILLARKNARPPYRTPWSSVNTRNNAVLVFQRNPHSTQAGRVLRLPDAEESKIIHRTGIGLAPARISKSYREVILV